VNPNRVFPGDQSGSYSEQMTHALINEFVVRADAYIDLHGGDIPEALVPFVICRAGDDEVGKKSKAIAMAFGLPHVLAISKPVQLAKGLSSYAAAAEKGIPAVLAEAGGVGQMQEDAVALLSRGVINVMRHLEMIESVADATAKANDEARMTNDETNPKSKIQKIAGSNMATTLLTNFEWLHTKSTGVWYPKVAPGDGVREGEQIGTIGDLFGDSLEEIVSPVNGVVLFLTINPSVLEKGLLMGIGAE
jgi:predicted deacylase